MLTTCMSWLPDPERTTHDGVPVSNIFNYIICNIAGLDLGSSNALPGRGMRREIERGKSAATAVGRRRQARDVAAGGGS